MRIYRAQNERTHEKGYENRPMPFALPAGSPMPNLKSTNMPEANTTSSLADVEATAVAKRASKPKRNALSKLKMAYDLGLELGKAAAIAPQERVPEAMGNILPQQAPMMKGLAFPKLVSPMTHNIKPIKTPASPAPKLPPPAAQAY